MVFIKTDNRNCFSLNFLLSLNLVELDFAWNNTLVSCPIDFVVKEINLLCDFIACIWKWLKISTLSGHCSEWLGALVPISVHCPHSQFCCGKPVSPPYSVQQCVLLEAIHVQNTVMVSIPLWACSPCCEVHDHSGSLPGNTLPPESPGGVHIRVKWC